MRMLTCTDAEVESLLDPGELIGVIRNAFRSDLAKVRMPRRLHLELDNSTMLIMPCSIVGEVLGGLKIVTVSRQPRLAGRVRASYVLLDGNSGATLAVFDANYLTDVRTAATSAVATDALARPDASILGIFGTGRQAAAHVAVLPLVRRFQHTLVCGSELSKSNAFAERMRRLYELDVTATDAATCAGNADVICTCTSSVVPLFPGGLLRAGTHLNLIGTFQAQAREVDSLTIQRSRVFVDTYEAAWAEAGDILIPLQSHEISQEHVLGDLHELVSDEKQGRASSKDITVFKSVGCALEDLVTAKLLMQALQSRSTIQL